MESILTSARTARCLFMAELKKKEKNRMHLDTVSLICQSRCPDDHTMNLILFTARFHHTTTRARGHTHNRQDAGARRTHVDKRSESYTAPSPQKWSASTEERTFLWLDQQDLSPVTPTLCKFKSHQLRSAHHLTSSCGSRRRELKQHAKQRSSANIRFLSRLGSAQDGICARGNSHICAPPRLSEDSPRCP